MSTPNYRFRRARLLASAALGAALCCAAGCEQQNEALELRREIADLRQQLRDKGDRIAALEAANRETNKELQQARGFTDADLEKIFYPTELVIDELTGGEDFDGDGGDDGVSVYLRPVDRVGDVLKVAGDIRVELYDLQAAEGQKLVSECIVPVDHVEKLWYGKLLTYHYAIECPWGPGRKPTHDEITVRATFRDFLTKRVLTAQRVVKVDLQ